MSLLNSERIVAHIDTGMGWRGGQRQVLLLALEQRRQGWHPLLVVQPGSRLERAALAAGLEVFSVRMHGELDGWAMWRVRKRLRSRLLRVVHAHTGHAHTILLVATLGLDVVRVVHRRVDFPPRRWLGSWIKYCWFPVTYICISQYILHVLLARGVPGHRLVHIPSAVSAPEAGVWSPAKGREGHPKRTIGVIGALVPHKGHRDVLHAFGIVRRDRPELELELLGSGPEKLALERLAVQLGIETLVHFRGEVTEPWGVAAEWTCLCVPSREEGLSTTVLDAMWFGIPIVATSAGGIPELLDEDCAFMAQPSEVDSLVAALEGVLVDPDLALERARVARQRVERFPGISETAAQVLGVYQTRMDERHRSESFPSASFPSA